MHPARRPLAALAMAMALALSPLASDAGTIYLCKSYGGATFWSQAHCGTHKALIESIASVPDGLPFEQQVDLAQQQRQPDPAQATTGVNTGGAQSSAAARNAECKRLEARISQLDSMARQPHSGRTQDRIRADRQQARDRQSSIRC